MQARPRRFPWLGHVIVFCLLWAFTLSPVIWLAVVNAGQPGAAIGLPELMAGWGIFGWLVMTPFVLGPLLFLVWALVLVIQVVIFLRGGGDPR